MALDLFISGLGVELGKHAEPATLAVEREWITADDQAASGQRFARVAGTGQEVPEMALTASRAAMEQAGLTGRDVDALWFGTTLFDGLLFGNVPAHLHNWLGMRERHPSRELNEMCNSGMAGVETAFDRMRARSETNAIVVSSDRYPPGWIDRWFPGVALADLAGAFALSTTGGFLRFLGLESLLVSRLAGMQRGHDRFGPPRPVNVYQRIKSFYSTVLGREEVDKLRAAHLTRLVDLVCRDAGVPLTKVDHMCYSLIGRELWHREVLQEFGLPEERTVCDFGLDIGHGGGGDIAAGLHHLITSGRMSPGDTALCIGSGGGLACTVGLVQMVGRPG